MGMRGNLCSLRRLRGTRSGLAGGKGPLSRWLGRHVGRHVTAPKPNSRPAYAFPQLTRPIPAGAESGNRPFLDDRSDLSSKPENPSRTFVLYRPPVPICSARCVDASVGGILGRPGPS